MDLGKLREDIAVVCRTAGLNGWNFDTDDPQNLPAAVVSGVDQMERLNRIVTRVVIMIDLYVSNAEPLDGSRALDRLLSTDVVKEDGKVGSLIDAFDAVQDGIDQPSWRSHRFDSAGRYTRVSMPGGGVALYCQVLYEFTA